VSESIRSKVKIHSKVETLRLQCNEFEETIGTPELQIVDFQRGDCKPPGNNHIQWLADTTALETLVEVAMLADDRRVKERVNMMRFREGHDFRGHILFRLL
jgi:hypothetical protein